MLPSKSRAGSSRDGSTPVWLARCTTASTPSSAGSRTAASPTSPMTTSASSAGTYDSRPVRRSSTTLICQSRSARMRLARFAPMNPQPPVTRTRSTVDIHLPYGPPFQGGSLILLRILGLLVAAVVLGLVVSRVRRRSLTLGDALILGSVAVGLTVVAIVPSVVDPLLTELGFPPGDERRVVGVLVLSNLLTFVLLFRAFAKTNQLEHRLGDYADRIASRMFAAAHEADRPG